MLSLGAPLDGGAVTEGGRQLALPFHLFLEPPTTEPIWKPKGTRPQGMQPGCQWKLAMKGHVQDRDRETLGARDPSLRKSQTLQGLLGTARAVADTRWTLGRPLEVGKRHQEKVRNGKVPER